MILLQPFVRTLRNHYPALVSAFLAAVFTVYYSTFESGEKAGSTQLIFTFIAGISLFIAVDLTFEKTLQHIARLTALVFLVIFHLWFDRKPNDHIVWGYLALFVFTHLFVSLAPWVRSRFKVSNDELWDHNWSLLTHVIRIGLQIGVLTLGFAAGLGAIKALFNVNIPNTVYAFNFAFFGYLMTALLLVTSFREKTKTDWLTNMLNIVTRTALTPVALLYFIICYAYTFKITIQMQWPKGVIGFLVSGLSVVVLLGLVAIWPKLQNNRLPKWEQIFWQSIFKILLIPQLLLFAAVMRRIWEYGFTDSRAYLFYLSLWGLTLCAYYWNPLKRQLVFIPATLAFISLICIEGPLSPVFVGKQSQIHRLQNMMAEMGLQKQSDGTFKSKVTLTREQNQKLTEQFKTLCTENGQSTLIQIFNMNIKLSNKDSSWQCHVAENDNERTNLEEIMIALGLQPTGQDIQSAPTSQNESELNYYTPTGAHKLRSGFDVYFGSYTSNNRDRDAEGPVVFKFDDKKGVLSFTFDNNQETTLDLNAHLKDLSSSKPVEINVGHAMGSLFIQIVSAYGKKTEKEVLLSFVKLNYAFKPSPFWKTSSTQNN